MSDFSPEDLMKPLPQYKRPRSRKQRSRGAKQSPYSSGHYTKDQLVSLGGSSESYAPTEIDSLLESVDTK